MNVPPAVLGPLCFFAGVGLIATAYAVWDQVTNLCSAWNRGRYQRRLRRERRDFPRARVRP